MLGIAHPGAFWGMIVFLGVLGALAVAFAMDDLQREALVWTVAFVAGVVGLMFAAISFFTWAVCGSWWNC